MEKVINEKTKSILPPFYKKISSKGNCFFPNFVNNNLRRNLCRNVDLAFTFQFYFMKSRQKLCSQYWIWESSEERKKTINIGENHITGFSRIFADFCWIFIRNAIFFVELRYYYVFLWFWSLVTPTPRANTFDVPQPISWCMQKY